MPKAVLKTEFRDTARASRAAQYGQWSPDERVFINASLTQHCCSLVQQTHAQRICAYIPVGNEPGNRAWLDTLAAHCTALFLPRSHYSYCTSSQIVCPEMAIMRQLSAEYFS